MPAAVSELAAQTPFHFLFVSILQLQMGMLIAHCHHLDWHCFDSKMQLVQKGHRLISQKMHVLWKEFVCTGTSWEMGEKKKTRARWQGSVTYADAGEFGRRCSRIWCINTTIGAAAARFLSWGFPEFGCEKSQRSAGTDHLVLVFLKKQWLSLKNSKKNCKKGLLRLKP